MKTSTTPKTSQNSHFSSTKSSGSIPQISNPSTRASCKRLSSAKNARSTPLEWNTVKGASLVKNPVPRPHERKIIRPNWAEKPRISNPWKWIRSMRGRNRKTRRSWRSFTKRSWNRRSIKMWPRRRNIRNRNKPYRKEFQLKTFGNMMNTLKRALQRNHIKKALLMMMIHPQKSPKIQMNSHPCRLERSHHRLNHNEVQ